MIKPLAVVASVVAAFFCASRMMAAVAFAVSSQGGHFSSMGPREYLNALSLFTVWSSACAFAASLAVCYMRKYPLGMRMLIVLLPMLLAGSLTIAYKALQLRNAAPAGALLGGQPNFSVGPAGLHIVPATAFLAGLLAMAIAVIVRSKGKSENNEGSRP